MTEFGKGITFGASTATFFYVLWMYLKFRADTSSDIVKEFYQQSHDLYESLWKAESRLSERITKLEARGETSNERED